MLGNLLCRCVTSLRKTCIVPDLSYPSLQERNGLCRQAPDGSPSGGVRAVASLLGLCRATRSGFQAIVATGNPETFRPRCSRSFCIGCRLPAQRGRPCPSTRPQRLSVRTQVTASGTQEQPSGSGQAYRTFNPPFSRGKQSDMTAKSVTI